MGFVVTFNKAVHKKHFKYWVCNLSQAIKMLFSSVQFSHSVVPDS